MSSLATIGHLRRAASQLPVSWYCDPATFEAEQRHLFARAPGYAGHELMVPNAGDYCALATRDNAQALVRNGEGVELISNICRHRQAIMLQGRGNAANIVCPIHRWTYDLRGELLGAPHFDDKPCLNLGRSPLQNWKGLLFDGKRDVARDLADVSVPQIDFSGHVLDRVHVHECEYNWKSFVEVYIEDYHVGPFHPGLGQFVTCDDLRWSFGDWYSVQTVGVNNALAKPGTETYARWHKAVVDFYRGETPPYGAIWMVYYPNVMIEWYPHVLDCQHADPARGRPHDQRRRVLLSGGDRAFRARVRRGRAGRVHGDRARGRRDLAAHRRRPPGAVPSGAQRRGTVSIADGGRDAALPRVHPARARRGVARALK